MQNLVSKIRKPMWSSSTNVTDRRTDDTQSQDHALHYNSASRGKNCNLMPRIASPKFPTFQARHDDAEIGHKPAVLLLTDRPSDAPSPDDKPKYDVMPGSLSLSPFLVDHGMK